MLYTDETLTPIQVIPYINRAYLSYSKHKSPMDNCIAVDEHGVLVPKNCPTNTRTVKEGNSRVEDGEKREIFIVPSSCGNSANSYLHQMNSLTNC